MSFSPSLQPSEGTSGVTPAIGTVDVPVGSTCQGHGCAVLASWDQCSCPPWVTWHECIGAQGQEMGHHCHRFLQRGPFEPRLGTYRFSAGHATVPQQCVPKPSASELLTYRYVTNHPEQSNKTLINALNDDSVPFLLSPDRRKRLHCVHFTACHEKKRKNIPVKLMKAGRRISALSLMSF